MLSEIQELQKSQVAVSQPPRVPYYRQALKKILLDETSGMEPDYEQRVKQHVIQNFKTFQDLNKAKQISKKSTPISYKLSNFGIS